MQGDPARPPTECVVSCHRDQLSSEPRSNRGPAFGDVSRRPLSRRRILLPRRRLEAGDHRSDRQSLAGSSNVCRRADVLHRRARGNLASTTSQVVILGAGFDSRAWRGLHAFATSTCSRSTIPTQARASGLWSCGRPTRSVVCSSFPRISIWAGSLQRSPRPATTRNFDLVLGRNNELLERRSSRRNAAMVRGSRGWKQHRVHVHQPGCFRRPDALLGRDACSRRSDESQNE